MENNDTRTPTILIINGAGGDLTWRKLMPALYDLHFDKLLPENFAIIGVDKKEMSNDSFRDHLLDGVGRFSRHGGSLNGQWKPFAGHIQYASVDFSADKAFAALSDQLCSLDKAWNTSAQRIFYFAVPPQMVGLIAGQMEKQKLCLDRERARIVVEKPFGRDLSSAQALNKTLTDIFAEQQIYRIDTIWEKKQFKTSWHSGSRTPFSSQSGIGAISTTSRSRSQRPSASNIAVHTMSTPELFAI